MVRPDLPDRRGLQGKDGYLQAEPKLSIDIIVTSGLLRIDRVDHDGKGGEAAMLATSALYRGIV